MKNTYTEDLFSPFRRISPPVKS